MSGAWVVRAGRGSENIEDFVEKGFVGLGYGANLAELSSEVTREELVQRFREANPGWRQGKVTGVAGQLYRFMREIAIGDPVVSADSGRRLYYLGTVDTEASLHASEDVLPWRRQVTWSARIPRDLLDVATRNSLGAIQSVFKLSEAAAADLRKHARPLTEPEDEVVGAGAQDEGDDDEGASLDELRQEVIEKSREFIQDMLAALDDSEMEHLVAGILRAMGYKTRVSPAGSDRGVDVFASPDGLGLQEPRIFCEVKHRKARMGSQEVRSFLGGRQSTDRCLYVSTGGFTKDARYEADRSSIPLTLIDLPMLRELLVEHYASLDIETKQLVPLTQVYWPLEAQS